MNVIKNPHQDKQGFSQRQFVVKQGEEGITETSIYIPNSAIKGKKWWI